MTQEAPSKTVFGELMLDASGTIDASWLASKLGKPVETAHVRGMDKIGGMSAEFLHVHVHCKGGETMTLALKTKTPKTPSSAMLGDAREALFYEHLAPALGVCVPTAFYSHGDMQTGRKAVLMECLQDALPAGLAFGPSNPNNWAVKDKLEEMAATLPDAEQISAHAFKVFAGLHARFWGEEALLVKAPWLRGAQWARGEGAETWSGAQKMASDAWAGLMEARAAGSSPLVWDDHLVQCLNHAFASVSWDAFQAELKTRQHTLVQGDCHPGNALWVRGAEPTAHVRLIDFEMVGVGSAAQELGQWTISHMEPATRRRCERSLVEGYHRELVAALTSRGLSAEAGAFGLEKCWAEYVAGGAGRWAWFVAYLGKVMPAAPAQFFHDQLAAFLRDHVPDPSCMPMPRV